MDNERFSLRLGAHPALITGTANVIRDGQPVEILESRWYLASEMAPNYKISDKVGLGVYYLYGHSIDEGVKNTHFMSLNTSLNNLYISEKPRFIVSPQAYYLLTDDLKDLYVVGFVSLIKRDSPLSVSVILN